MHADGDRTSRVRDLVRRFGLRPGEVIVEPGCGAGNVTPFLLEALKGRGIIHALDYAPRMADEARRKRFAGEVRVYECDVCRMPLADGAADAVVCFHAFPHFSDPAAALREIRRVLRARGRLILAHLRGSNETNAFHSGLQAPVRQDRLPDEAAMRALLHAAHFRVAAFEDESERYLVIALKQAAKRRPA
jgi:ubiquinone/menaquinone biosynthesis C-methylase UbiE